MEVLSKDFQTNVTMLNDILGVGRNYDITSRELVVGGKHAHLYFLDGYGKDQVIERTLAFILTLTPQQLQPIQTMDEFASHFGTYGETVTEDQMEPLVTSLLLGKCVLLIEGMDKALLFDAKMYPMRGIEEPADGKVLRGSHDGFTEVVKKNSALIRRRIRDPKLVMENHRVGTRSKTDVVLCYLDDRVDRKALEQIRSRLDKIDVYSVSMGQGEYCRGDAQTAMVQSVPSCALYRAPRCSGGVRYGRQYYFDGRQFLFCNDFTHFIF